MIWPVGEWLLVFLAAVLLFVLPGWVLLRLWSGSQRLTLMEQSALATGIGMAFYPVLLLWTDMIGLHLGALYAWLPLLSTLILLIWMFHRRKLNPVCECEGWRAREQGGNTWPSVTLLVVLLAIIVIRFLATMGWHVPLWGDSLHHTMIAQLLIEQNGLFRSWQPYAAMQSFTYHFGFHSHVAVLAWSTGIDTLRIVILTGQIANIAAVFTLYPLALRLGRSRWAGVVALLIAGLLVSIPMTYVNWGRYTQLAGQAILPVAIYLAWEFLTERDRSWALLGITALTLAGLVLTHYRVTVFAACFFPAFVVLVGSHLPWRVWIGRGILLASVTGILVVFWLARILSGKLPTILGAIAAQSMENGGDVARTETLHAINTTARFLPALLWYALLLSIFWALWRRNRSTLVVAMWWLLAFLVVNPYLVGLPGTGTMTNFALFLAAYVPAALLVGTTAGWLLRRLHAPVALACTALVITILTCWGVVMRLNDVNIAPHTFVTAADLRAAAWIEQHTAADAQFLINGFFPNEAAVVGSDAGWWLPLLAHRQTTVPPLLYIAEQGPRPAYRQWVNEVYTTLYTYGIDHPATLELLRERDITHVYIGQQQGTVGYNGTEQRLVAEQLDNSPHFRTVYHHDQVWVFALQPEEKLNQEYPHGQ